MSKKKSSTKCRNWCFVLYPEDEGTQDLLDYLSTNNIERIRGVYIKHQAKAKVNKETGEPVIGENGVPELLKEHYHVMVNFPNARSSQGVVKALCLYKSDNRTAYEDNNPEELLDGDIPEDAEKVEISGKKCIRVEPVNDICSMYYYFLHWSYACQRENKERYEEKDIKLLGNDSADFSLSCKGERDLTSRVTCAELLTAADHSADCRELLKNVIDDEHLVKFMLKNPYFVSKFIVGDKNRLK